MTLLVVGTGAEDVTTELGRLVLDAGALTDGAFGLDLQAAEDACLTGAPQDLVDWALRELTPAVVLLADGTAGHDLLTPGARPEAVPVGHPEPEVLAVDRPTAVRALRLWVRGEPAARDVEAEDEQTLAVVAVLRQRLARRGVRRVRERAPRVSVIMPVHNYAEYLEPALDSVLQQTYRDFEVVVLDDGSTDATPEILQRYAADPRVRVITQSNVGRTGRIDLAWNRLVHAARGDLLAVHGADDISLPHRLASQVRAFDEDPQLQVCHGGGEVIDGAGRLRGTAFNLALEYDDLNAARQMLVANLVAHPSVMLRKEAHQRVGMWAEGFAADYHFWLKSAGTLRFRYLPTRLFQYRVHEKSMSTSSQGLPTARKEGRRVRRQVLLRRPLSDFFPELGAQADARAWYEAAVALGNSLLTVDPELALIAYDRAADALPGHEAQHNRATAHLLLGDRSAALAAARAAVEAAPEADRRHSEALVQALQAGDGAEATVHRPQNHLGPALLSGRRALSEHARRWDGTPLSVANAYVAVDPGRLDVARVALEHWCGSTRSGDPVRWTVPHLGHDLNDTLGWLGAAAAGLPLDQAGDLVLEAVDDLAMLPPSPTVPTGVLRTSSDLAQFCGWMSTCAGGGMRPAA